MTAAYGDGSLIVCDNVVRIYQVESIEVQALQGSTSSSTRVRCWRSWEPPARASPRC